MKHFLDQITGIINLFVVLTFLNEHYISISLKIIRKLWFSDVLRGIKMEQWWRRGVVVITTAQLHLTKPELRFCAGSNPARGVSEICDDEDL